MTDQNPGFGLFVLGQKDDIRRLAELAAEPWKAAKGKPADRAASGPGFLTRFNRLFDSPPPEPTRVSFTSACMDCPTGLCCSEPLA
jgi:hypothetical protein